MKIKSIKQMPDYHSGEETTYLSKNSDGCSRLLNYIKNNTSDLIKEAREKMDEETKDYLCIECIKKIKGILHLPIDNHENRICFGCEGICTVYKYKEQS